MHFHDRLSSLSCLLPPPATQPTTPVTFILSTHPLIRLSFLAINFYHHLSTMASLAQLSTTSHDILTCQPTTQSNHKSLLSCVSPLMVCMVLLHPCHQFHTHPSRWLTLNSLLPCSLVHYTVTLAYLHLFFPSNCFLCLNNNNNNNILSCPTQPSINPSSTSCYP